MQAIILAGGKGTRLKPFTTNFPKPLVPIGGKPILEIVLRQLSYYGFTDIILTVNHLADLIKAYFGDGKQLGLNITYSLESEPLGTAGPLSLIPNLEENFLVMNADLLTTLDFSSLANFHKTNNNDITITVFKRKEKIDLGVLEIEGNNFVNYIEKPIYEFNVSMGIYMINRKIVSLLQYNQKCDMPDLIMNAKKEGKRIQCLSAACSWLDIGRIDDYDKATDIFQEKEKDFLPY